jgi:uncharacterized membrane protein
MLFDIPSVDYNNFYHDIPFAGLDIYLWLLSRARYNNRSQINLLSSEAKQATTLYFLLIPSILYNIWSLLNLLDHLITFISISEVVELAAVYFPVPSLRIPTKK